MSTSRRVRLVAAAVVLVVIAAACQATPGDFTGDARADMVYENFQSGNWYSAGQATPIYTGQAEDLPVPGDYNGDGKWEPAVLRGTTWISSALTSPIVYDPAGLPAGPPATPAGMTNFTLPTLVPVPGDYDGTGKTVPAYYDLVDATWWIMGRTSPTKLGQPPKAGGTMAYDVPVPADYDGDGKTDLAVFRPTDGSFHYLSSKTGKKVALTPPAPRSEAALLPVPADYDKVGHAETAVADLDGVNWYVQGHPGVFANFPIVFDGNYNSDNFIPAPADYDGDGKAEPMLVDSATGAFWPLGQPMPPRAVSVNSSSSASVYPIAITENIVRLTLYAQFCIFPTTFTPPPGAC